VLLVILALWFPALDGAHAAGHMACELARFDRYAAAQERWQRDLAELIGTRYPELAEVAVLYRDDQLVRIALRRLIVRHLAEGRPQPLDPRQPLGRWALLEPAGESRLAESDPEVAELLASRRAARERAPHPDGDRLRRILREELAQAPAFLAIRDELLSALAEAEEDTCD
jgi:hypothetical protein